MGPDYTLSVGGLPISLSPTGEGSVTIPAGKSSVSIRLAVAADSILEWDETARVEILPAPTGWQPYGIIPNRSFADVTILDDEAIGGLLSTGRYDYDIALRDAEGRVRTIRGATEIVNRAEEAFGETEFGRRWWLPLLDRLVPGDGISRVMRSATPIPMRSTPTSRLAPPWAPPPATA